MEINFNPKEQKVIDFLSSLNNQKNKDILIKYLVKKGLQGISKNLKNVPTPIKEIFNEMINTNNLENKKQ